mmetsp:Transcript_88803/g.256110  ORF Transcript_88803/g.256110 Transcript_88803/m.256110 type:complete len:210 (+) Transcript_88803:129-758(+)
MTRSGGATINAPVGSRCLHAALEAVTHGRRAHSDPQTRRSMHAQGTPPDVRACRHVVRQGPTSADHLLELDLDLLAAFASYRVAAGGAVDPDDLSHFAIQALAGELAEGDRRSDVQQTILALHGHDRCGVLHEHHVPTGLQVVADDIPDLALKAATAMEINDLDRALLRYILGTQRENATILEVHVIPGLRGVEPRHPPDLTIVRGGLL